MVHALILRNDVDDDMPTAVMPAIERIARVIAAQRLSANADGSDPSAGSAVDMEWQVHVEDAYAVLRTLREPDAAMVEVGDIQVWERMIKAALGSV
jgi:diphthamide synthase (EF-2-diphthine--ammonia ligase)